MTRATSTLVLVALLLVPGGAAVGAPTVEDVVALVPWDQLPAFVPEIIPETTVLPFELRPYQGRNYTVVGTITVADNGTLLMGDAHFEVAPSSSGIRVLPGGTLRMTRSVFESTAGASTNGSSFAIELEPGSHLEISDSTVRGGAGLVLRTADATIEGNLFERNVVGLTMVNVTVTIADNHFLSNQIGIDQTGGASRITRNTIEDSAICLRDFRTDPIVDNNTLRACTTGILHEQSATRFEFNDIEDRFDPEGIGLDIIDQVVVLQAAADGPSTAASGATTLVRNNTISRFGTGIRVRNAAVTIVDNVVNDSVLDGIRIESNLLETHVENNTVHHNANGIRVVSSPSVPVKNNTVHNNSAVGVLYEGSSGGLVADNLVADNANAGIRISSHHNATIGRNVVRANGIGIRIEAGAPDALVHDNVVSESAGVGIDARADRGNLTRNDVTGSGDAGVRAAARSIRVWDGALRSNLIGLEADGASDLSVKGTSIRLNTGHGVDYHGSDDAVFDHVNASANGGDGLHVVAQPGDTVAISCTRALGNALSGLLADGSTGTSASSAWFEGNGAFGVLWTGAGSISATGSYWGAASGPTHSGNPGGTGDAVSDGVSYAGFLAAPPTC